ncbi:MAG: asparagine synthase (glutamine-hydrolyzing), partial [Salinarimonadaceae bacterium]
MCGIVAVWRPGGVDAAEIEGALRPMASRGPDAKAVRILAEGRLGLGHLRLSILDLSSSANQPMSDAAGGASIVYNGEIVNFREVRAGMGARNWRTDGDTEVLLEAFLERGPGALHDCVGMFAFALHDAREGALHLARDRFGIKPLYWTRLPDGGFAAASEIPPLLALRGGRAQADEDTILTYLESGVYDASEKTFFEGVSALPPGACARLDLATGGMTITRWYDFCAAVAAQDAPRDPRDWRPEIAYRVERAVKDHLIADVPVGLNVSGGVDSSLLCALAGEELSDLHVFTQDFEPPYSERAFVEQAVGRATLHVSTLRSEDIREALARTVARQAEPFGGVSVIGYDALYRAADSAGVTVLLDGNGVDEVFLGYGKYRALAQGRLSADAAVSIDGTRSTLPEAIAPGLRRRAAQFSVPTYAEAFVEPVRAMAARDLLHAKIPRGLRFNDRMSMLRSKELRVPFLDHRLVERVFRVPVDLLLRDDV